MARTDTPFASDFQRLIEARSAFVETSAPEPEVQTYPRKDRHPGLDPGPMNTANGEFSNRVFMGPDLRRDDSVMCPQPEPPMTRLLAPLAALILLAAAPAARAQGAQANVDSLLAADRAFSAAAASAATPADALAAMFDPGVVVPGGPALTIGRDAALAAFRAAPAWQSGTVSWRPVRGGVSADGMQGFTYGYLTVTAGPPERRARKYLAYWVRRPEGWRVVAWRQNPHPPGAPTGGMHAPALPGFATAPAGDAAVATRHQASLAAAEQAFSDRAQQVGLAAAFAEYGRPDATNLGAGGAAFVTGAEAIAAGMDNRAPPSPLRWSTERSVVASSGDLGVSMGLIRRNTPGTDGRPDTISFFTVWKRDTPDGPWRYIAE
jgi:ketosteroid isomerase-like protein